MSALDILKKKVNNVIKYALLKIDTTKNYINFILYIINFTPSSYRLKLLNFIPV